MGGMQDVELQARMQKLSRHLPTAIRQAVEDVKKLSESPDYVINMGTWHTPAGDRCQVCAAGAWLAVRAGYPKERLTEFDLIPSHVATMMDCIDLVRGNYLISAIAKSGGKLWDENAVLHLTYVSYEDGIEEWSEYMLTQADWLDANCEWPNVNQEVVQ